MAKVYLSPSNHGVNQNKCLKDGCYEDKHTRPIAESCAKYLKTSGVSVKIAAASASVTGGERTRESDNFGADLYVPVHTNAFRDKDARYLMLMFYADTEKYREIFNSVAPRLEAIYPGGIKAKFAARPELIEVNGPKAPTMYCELGFHTNRTDVDNFIHEPDKVGKALANGICDYLGIEFEGKTSGSSGSSAGSSSSGGSGSSSSAGTAIKLSGAPLYAASTSRVPSTHVTGTYYRWDDEVIRGRVRITNLKSRVGAAGQVTGWIDEKYL